MNGSGVLRAILFGIAVTSLAACGDCGAGAEDAGSGSDAYQAPHDAAGVDTVGTDRHGQDTHQPPADAAHPDTAATDLRGQDTYQPPTDAAGHDSATGTDASTCPTRVCDTVCCQAGEVCSLLDGECCSGSCAGKDCGDDGCGTSCGTCTGQMCDSTQHCVAITTPANDSCAGAIELTFDSDGVATVHGDTVGATGDSSSARCGMMPGDQWPGGKDVVYTFTLSAATPMTFALRYSDSTQPMLYLKSSCAGTTYQEELFCSMRDGSGGAGAHVSSLPSGTYFLWVDSQTADTGGAYTLVVSKDPLPANDTCAGAQALDVSSGHVSVAVDLTDAANDDTGTCGAMLGKDMVYRFVLGATKSVVAAVRRTSLSTASKAAVYVRSACTSTAPSDEVACEHGTGIYGEDASVTIWQLPAGTYYVFVDSMDYMDTATLELTVSDPPSVPDNCATAQPLTFDSSGSVHVQPNLVQGADDTAPFGCGGAGAGSDLVYSFHLSATSNVYALAYGYNAEIYVRSACASTASADELGCQIVSEAAEIALPRLAAGDYWVWLDQPTAGAGGATLQVTAVAPPAGDSCDDAQALTFSANQATASGNLVNAFDDYHGSCGGSLTKDVVYTFTLDQPKVVGVQVAAPSGSAYYTVYLRSGCTSGQASDELGCRTGGNPVITSRLEQGSYAIVVEQSYGSNPAFDLTVTLADLPANDLCANAIPIQVGDTVIGDTSYAVDDYGASGLSEVCYSATMAGPDLVYSFTPATSGTFTIVPSPDDFFCWIATACGSAADCLGLGGWGGLVFDGTEGTTYYIIVDTALSTQRSAFSFTLN